MKFRHLCALLVCLFLVKPPPVWARATLSSDLGLHSAYFLSDDSVRHFRYEIGFRQSTSVASRWSTTVEARVRADLGVTSLFKGNSYPSEVAQDEKFEAEPRQLFLDYFGNKANLKVGLMPLAWTESLFPFANNLLSPLDLRHGAYDTPKQIRIPLVGLDINHKLGPGTVNWLLIPFSRAHRFPAARNGYGYHEYLSRLVAPAAPVLTQSPIPSGFAHMEGGVRYWLRFDSLEITPLLFWGHQRVPTLSLSPVSASVVNVTATYPRVTTFGVLSNYGQDAWILRTSVLAQLKRSPLVINNPAPNTNYWERLIQTLVAFDYVFSKHLKLYSELSSRWSQFSNENTTTQQSTDAGSQNQHILSLRLTNESLKDVFLTLEASLCFPEKAVLLSPQIEFTINRDYKLTLGARVLDSSSNLSPLEILKGTDQILSHFPLPLYRQLIFTLLRGEQSDDWFLSGRLKELLERAGTTGRYQM